MLRKIRSSVYFYAGLALLAVAVLKWRNYLQALGLTAQNFVHNSSLRASGVRTGNSRFYAAFPPLLNLNFGADFDAAQIFLLAESLLIMLGVIVASVYIMRVRSRRGLAETHALYGELQQNFRNLVEKSNDAIYVLQDDKYVMVNPKFEKLLGYPRHEVLHEKFYFMQLIAPESRADVSERLRKRRNGEPVPKRFELKAVAKSGQILDLEVSVSDIEWENRSAILGLCRDVTKRKKSEQQTRELAAQLTNILHATSDGILVVSYLPTGETITLANPRFGEIFGIDYRTVIGRTDEMVRAEAQNCFKDPSTFQREVRRLYREREEVHICELELVSPQPRMLERWSGPVRDNQGRVIGRIWSFRDITHRKELESRLAHSLKLESIGRLAGGIAHDFNNILTGIRGYADLLKMTLPAMDGQSPELNEISKCVERAAELTQQLLAFSRRQVIQPRVVNFNQLLRENERMLRRLIGEDVALQIVPGPELWNIRVDPGQMTQIIFNLAANARDAMPEGGSVRIATNNVALPVSGKGALEHNIPAGRYVHLIFSDTGMGMDAEVKAHIFEPFFTTKETGKGTGLGLATAYGIVKQHRGYIEVSSAPQHGTTFDIYFPAVNEQEEKTAINGEMLPPVHGSETILLVEDEPSVRAVTKKILEMFGYRVLVATTASEAQNLFSINETEIALLITDVIMPGQNGRALAEDLCRRKQALRVLFMSGYTNDVIVRHGVFDANLEYLQKPFIPLRLGQKVREILDQP
jgi:PAS domain S-box-containing protein